LQIGGSACHAPFEILKLSLWGRKRNDLVQTQQIGRLDSQVFSAQFSDNAKKIAIQSEQAYARKNRVE